MRARIREHIVPTNRITMSPQITKEIIERKNVIPKTITPSQKVIFK
jgi:hypothetical protein